MKAGRLTNEAARKPQRSNRSTRLAHLLRPSAAWIPDPLVACDDCSQQARLTVLSTAVSPRGPGRLNVDGRRVVRRLCPARHARPPPSPARGILLDEPRHGSRIRSLPVMIAVSRLESRCFQRGLTARSGKTKYWWLAYGQTFEEPPDILHHLLDGFYFLLTIHQCIGAKLAAELNRVCHGTPRVV